MTMIKCNRFDFAKKSLLIAGVYNIVWGTIVVLFPMLFFDAVGLVRPTYPAIWQCVGMIVGVYGVGYIIAFTNPLTHWPIILVGFLGKLFGPIGFIIHLINGTFPLYFGWVILFNDIIWWYPFGYLLYKVAKASND